ncbi:hypothetical protein IMZ48_09540, partial [Candidatus Bathyarchaeota archaeon]|nr:hypothetical protein [Candidatus Bathyarchaeota archaeon]
PVVKAPVVKAPVVKVKDDEEDELPTQLPEKKKTVAEGGFATSKNLVVPIDPAVRRFTATRGKAVHTDTLPGRQGWTPRPHLHGSY